MPEHWARLFHYRPSIRRCCYWCRRCWTPRSFWYVFPLVASFSPKDYDVSPPSPPFFLMHTTESHHHRKSFNRTHGGRIQDSVHHKIISYSVTHGRCPGRNQRCSWKHGRWWLAMAHVSSVQVSIASVRLNLVHTKHDFCAVLRVSSPLWSTSV